MKHDEWDELEKIDLNLFTDIWLVLFPFIGIGYYIFLSDTLSKALGIHFLLTLLIVIAYAALKFAILIGIILLRFKKSIGESLLIVRTIYWILDIAEFFLSWGIIFASTAFVYPEIRLLIVLVGSSLLLLTPVRLPFYIKIVRAMVKDPNEFRRRVKKSRQSENQGRVTEQLITLAVEQPAPDEDDADAPLAPDQKRCWACNTVQRACHRYCINCNEKL
ncbi:MAG: hypothetical protein IJW70_03535 [Clostridia bacterium]|nr:hypothetical protein [Clostridia bacterium]